MKNILELKIIENEFYFSYRKKKEIDFNLKNS